jgi:hypothetical protein
MRVEVNRTRKGNGIEKKNHKKNGFKSEKEDPFPRKVTYFPR